jgi:hypothetical protein
MGHSGLEGHVHGWGTGGWDAGQQATKNTILGAFRLRFLHQQTCFRFFFLTGMMMGCRKIPTWSFAPKWGFGSWGWETASAS